MMVETNQRQLMPPIRLLVVEPVSAENLAKNDGSGGGKALIVADDLGPGLGQMIAFTEGAEASNPYWPKQVPVDAYCALIVNTLDDIGLFAHARVRKRGISSREIFQVGFK